jgi:hypothetical protein
VRFSFASITVETVAKVRDQRKAGSGRPIRCPAHDDRTPSLSICDTDPARWACDLELVVAARRTRPISRERIALETDCAIVEPRSDLDDPGGPRPLSVTAAPRPR